jgi:hypothetical protein
MRSNNMRMLSIQYAQSKKYAKHWLSLCIVTYLIEYLSEFEFIFEIILDYESGDQMGSFDAKKPPSKMSCLGSFKQPTPLLNPLILWKVTGVDTSWILIYIDLFSKLKICCTLFSFAFRFLLVQCVTLSGFQGRPEKLGEIRHCLGTIPT